MKSVAPLAFEQSGNHWFFRYKLHHLPFWFGYHFMWWTLRLGSPMVVISSLALPHAAAKFLFYLVFQMLGVYFNLYFLVPRYLEKGRYLKYVSLLVFTIIFTAALIVASYYVVAWLSGKGMLELFGVDPANYFSLFEAGALPSTAASMTLAMSIKLATSWIKARQREEMLEREKLETELKFLRAQFNPHFLFNTINSIFVLINKNQRMATESLANFSALLRYQLYECNEPQIPLVKELTYLENFIELQKLRQDGNVELNCQIERQFTTSLCVAPFILMPFVENAFKHVSQYRDRPNWIKLNLRLEEDQLILDLSNSASHPADTTNDAVAFHGIGLKNVRRRLDLLYPKHYDLKINDDDNVFHVLLRLDLMEQAVEKPEMVELA